MWTTNRSIAQLVAGRTPDAARDLWAREREAFVLDSFAGDRAITRDLALSEERETTFLRWFANAGSPPEGWPGKLGYWVGMRLAQAYVERADDDPMRRSTGC